MGAPDTERLIRRQYLVSRKHIEKVKQLSQAKGVSDAEIIRRAIDAYDPDATGMNEGELEAALETMETALRQTRDEVAGLRQRLNERLSDEVIEARRARIAEETGAELRADPRALAALSRALFPKQGSANGGS
ncbi:hypothetical protein [Arhodomonas sp. SL1]|uniref:hypothetical protein n=1 Tax=Arhodomonas sp. SL1 TaxID=3425691 RepID=UPI003F883EC8